MNKTANILIHQSPYYRLHTFSEGLKTHGFRIINDRNASPRGPDDVLLLWNRNRPHEQIAQRYEAAGATVLITENGYLGKSKEDRWSRLKIDVKPWREDGDYILVLPQRSIGEIGVAMPRNWEQTVIPRLKKMTKRPIRLRKHPGKNSKIQIEEDLAGAWAAVTWASGAGIKAICAGIPVFHDYAKWIGAPAATCTFNIEQPYLGERDTMFHRLAWAQWSWDEIKSGEAFKCLL